MTLHDIRVIKGNGVICKSDAGLYLDNAYRATLKFLSIYGSPQQVRAIFAMLVGHRNIEMVSGEGEVIPLTKGWGREGDKLRLKTIPLGYGKRHGLIFTEGLGKETIFWTSPEEKEARLYAALSRRRIPFDRAWLSELEKILVEEDQLISLSGWGGFSGYDCVLNDDRVCDLIVEKILPNLREVGGKNGTQDIYREIWAGAQCQDRREHELRL